MVLPRYLLLKLPQPFQVLIFRLQGSSFSSFVFFLLCVMLFSLLFDYHYFTSIFDYGFPTSSTSFFHSLNLDLGECHFVDLLFLGLDECYWMEFSLNVYEIKFFLVI